MIVATQLRAIVEAVWLGAVVDLGVGARALGRIIYMLTVPLAVLVAAAGVIFAATRRELGRAFDLACVAVLPIVVVMLVAGVVGVIPETIATVAAYGWTAALVVLAALPRAPRTPKFARLAGAALVALALAGMAIDGIQIATHTETVRPMKAGSPAPDFTLSGFHLADARGKVVVIDFWATWCRPCLRALPELDAFARRHPEVIVLAIAMDDPEGARETFAEKHYTPRLLQDDGEVSRRFGVMTIPHTVVIDRRGNVHEVSRGGELDLERELREVDIEAPVW